MSGVSVELENLNEVLSDLKDYSKDVRRGAEIEVQKTVLNISGEAKQRARVKTGFLRSSIYPKAKGLNGIVEARADYAPYVEFGTSRSKAYPFLIPAYKRQVRFFMTNLKRLMNK